MRRLARRIRARIAREPQLKPRRDTPWDAEAEARRRADDLLARGRS